jgi:hypothetical protein
MPSGISIDAMRYDYVGVRKPQRAWFSEPDGPRYSISTGVVILQTVGLTI